MANTGAPTYLEYLETHEGAPEIAWRENMDKINDFLATLSGGGAIITRSVVTVTTSVLAPGAKASALFVAMGLGGIIYEITTSDPAWVELYAKHTYRLADLSRPIEQDPRSGAGVIAEVLTKEGALSIPMSPAPIYWNDEYPVNSDIPITVTNYDDAPRAILVRLDYLRIENAIS